jgi:molybdenum cofactor synthesis domain-containing protein
MSRTEGFQKLTRVDEALRIILGALPESTVRLEFVPLERAFGRSLGKDVVANRNLPPADRSAMDGYAVRFEDVRSAVILRLVGESTIGVRPRTRIGPGEVVAVSTGSLVPPGADSVIMVEETTRLSAGQVAVNAPAKFGQSVSRKGEDVSPGTIVLRKGVLLRSQDIGVLKALGLVRTAVARKPRVAVLSTGDELVNSPNTRNAAKVVDINRVLISCMLQELGAEAVDCGMIRDHPAHIKKALRKALKGCDAVVVSAGSSVGKRDLVPECIDSLGRPGMLVHGVAMRPAMPTGLAVVKGKAVFSLPGFPVSAFFAFRTFVRPIVARMLGVKELPEPTANAVLKERITGLFGNRTYVRVSLNTTAQGLVAEPLKLQRSSVLMSMVRANGFVTVPEEVKAIDAGETVTVTLFGGMPP